MKLVCDECGISIILILTFDDDDDDDLQNVAANKKYHMSAKAQNMSHMSKWRLFQMV